MSMLKAAALAFGLLAPVAVAWPVSAATLSIFKQDANGRVFNYANRQNAGYIGTSDTVNGQSRSTIAAGVFWLAVWEIVSEAGGLDLATGNFVLNRTSSNAAKNMAQGWLDQVANRTFRPNRSAITTLTAPDTQDLLTNDPSPVPLPAGLGLPALGLPALGMTGLTATKGQRAVV